MDQKLNQEELGHVLQVMRILAPDIGEDKFQVLLDAQEYLLASGFLDAVWGIVRLQEEEDINLSDTIDRFQELINENKKLIARQASIKEMLVKDQEIHRQILSDIAAARKELEAVTDQNNKEKEGLAALVEKAGNDKKRIDTDLENYRQKAGITQTEIKAAGSLKALVKKYGFSLDMILNLVKEFAPYQDSRERLSVALEKEGSLTQQIAFLEKEMEEHKKTITETIAELISQKTRYEDDVRNLRNICHQWESNLNRLKTNVEEEQQLRQFWVKYQPSIRILDCLSGWKQVLFLRCNNSGCEPFGGINHFWSEKKANICPHCGSGLVYYDEELYNVLNLEMRPFKLILE